MAGHPSRDGDAPRGGRPGRVRLPPEEVLRLLERAQSGDDAARDLLVRAYMGVVERIARQYEGSGLPHEDLVGEGAIGLLKAIRSFDPRRSLHLALHASSRIHRVLRRIPAWKPRAPRIPTCPVEKARGVLAGRLRREPTCREIARFLSPSPGEVIRATAPTADGLPSLPAIRRELRKRRWSAALVRRILDAGGTVPEVDPIHAHGEDVHDLDAIAAEDAAAGALETRDLVHAGLGRLDPRSRLVLLLHWGMAGPPEFALPGYPPSLREPGVGLTLQEIGDLLGVTRERVRQIEVKAMEKLERWLRKELDLFPRPAWWPPPAPAEGR